MSIHEKRFNQQYSGEANMSTAFGWIRNAYAARQLSDPQFGPNGPRYMIASSALDGVFILGKGACLFENNIACIFCRGHKARAGFPRKPAHGIRR
jgi:hypothetical protein